MTLRIVDWLTRFSYIGLDEFAMAVHEVLLNTFADPCVVVHAILVLLDDVGEVFGVLPAVITICVHAINIIIIYETFKDVAGGFLSNHILILIYLLNLNYFHIL